jgi:predicted ribonuclease YlaK
MKKDPYQALVVDSFNNNKITMVKGPAGSGKTILSLGYLFNQLEKGKIDRIIIFCNTVATKNSARLGFYPGTRDEKLLDSQIGNLLSSKMGGRYPVEQLIQQDKLVLLPFSDIRGYDTSGMKAGIYISEAQNLDISLMKLALQRIGEDCICIIDGDEAAQVDLAEYEGANNGMRRTSKIFRGADLYGEITLKTVHRSRIADLAQKL